MWQNFSKYYRLKSADTICEQFNRFVNMLKKERRKHKKDICGLESNDERKYMPDKEIFDKYVDLDKSCLTDEEKT